LKKILRFSLCLAAIFKVALVPSLSWAISEIEKVISSAEIDEGLSPPQQAAALTHHLEQNGYLLATVSIEPDGSFVVDPGHISEVAIEGMDLAASAHAKTIIIESLAKGVTVANLDRALALINDMPGVAASFNFNRLPDGNFELFVKSSQSKSLGGVSLENTVGNLGKGYKFNLNQNVSSILTGGDLLRLQGVVVDGGNTSRQQSISTSYQFPVGSKGAYLEIGAGDYRAQTTLHSRPTAYTTSFGAIVVPGSKSTRSFEGKNYYLTGGYPLIRYHDEAFYLIGQIDYSDDKTLQVGESAVTHADLGLFYSKQRPDGTSYHLGGFLGIGRSEDFIANNELTYSSAEITAGYITTLKSLSDFTELRIETNGKLSDKKLPNSKLFSLGSEDFMRGYDSSVLVGNAGIQATAELAHAYYFDGAVLQRVAPYIFVDIGQISNSTEVSNNRTRPKSQQLMSIGVGADVLFTNGVSIGGYLGSPLLEDTSGNVPDTIGFVRLTWNW